MAHNAIGDSSWSTAGTFKVRTAMVVPSAPTLISPTNNFATTDTDVEFKWNAVTGANYYMLSVWRTDKPNMQWGCITTETKCSELERWNDVNTDELAQGFNYSWKVQAHVGPVEPMISDDYWSEPSEVRTLTISELNNGGNNGNNDGNNNSGSSSLASPVPSTPVVGGVGAGSAVPVSDSGMGGNVALIDDLDVDGGIDEDAEQSIDTDASTESNKDSDSDAKKDDKENKPFLYLGWWWLGVLTIVAVGAHFLFRKNED